jgi:hypothetical protein
VADARAERLRLLHAAGVALARSLDAAAVVHELARRWRAWCPHDGLVVAHPDLAAGTVRTALRQVRGLARPRADLPLGAGPLAEAARTGAPVRLDEYDPARSPLAAADDVVGDGGPARSVLAVPMRAGTRLMGVLAVHAAAPAAFGDEDVEVLRTAASQAAAALANAEAYAESEAERRQSEALVALARAVGGSRRPARCSAGLRHTLALLGRGGGVRRAAHGGAPAWWPGGSGRAPAGDLGRPARGPTDGPGRAAAGRGAAGGTTTWPRRARRFPLHDVTPVDRSSPCRS